MQGWETEPIPLMKKHLSSSLEKMDGALHRQLSRIYRRDMRERPQEATQRHVRYERVSVDGDLISYVPDETDQVGVYVAADSLSPENSYFEVEILDMGIGSGISVGLVTSRHSLQQHPGCAIQSIGYHTGRGRLIKGASKRSLCLPKCETGDKIGCGIKFEKSSVQEKRQVVTVFFTRNGKEINSTSAPWPLSGLYPAVGVSSLGEEVRISLCSTWTAEEDIFMCIDSNEDEWARLHDIQLNGSVLEYAGRGKSIIDVGLAQARSPLDTTSHYFEIEIVEPGENCYIAIGLARRDYPRRRHPGWNKGSIAYHADDGKIFVGSGVGDPFGPRCHKGDVMGCGIIYPSDYVSNYDSDDSREIIPSPSEFPDDEYASQSESEDEEWWREGDNIENGSLVQVFFTRNGKTIGRKEVCIPKGGFYPTIGMLSSEEKVKVDLHPLTG
ncbi:SPRY domain-containing protein 3-like isoform X2 [Tachypleus tridentatus]|uniref:SPRY domain-containing protein 3-like isoform X2 n=1 Tax=Tachypleus tridentatus TaxID=6853 RepID=UPI003FD555BA